MQSISIISRPAVFVALAVSLLVVLAVAEVRTNKYRPSKLGYLDEQQQSGDSNGSPEGQYGADSGELVDKLASAAGDFYWPVIMPQLPADWYQQALAGRLHQLDLEEAPLPAPTGQYQQPSRGDKRQLASSFRYNSAKVGGDYEPSLFGLHNYRALIGDFKHLPQHLTSPMREGRAFKPKLMSTARGFGKRASGSDGSISFAELLAAANSEATASANGKMSGNAIR